MTKPKAAAPKKQPQARKTAIRGAHNPEKPGAAPGPATKPPRARVDWDALAPHYRAGIRSLKDIGAEFEVSDAAIIKHAKKEGWTRDLKGKIKAKADAKVSAATVSAEVSAQTKITEALTVEVESTVLARVRLAHRSDIGKGRALAMKLLSELEHQTEHQELYEQLADLLAPIDDEQSERAKERSIKLRQAFERATSLPGRTKTMKDLADTLRTLVGLEREAYGLSSGDEGGSSDFERLVGDLPEAAV